MEITLNFTKSAQDNANDYFSKAKKSKHKEEGATEIIKKLDRLREEAVQKKELERTEKNIKKIVEKKWYEKFHWFFTSNGMLAIGGRDAQQNELVNSRYFEDADLFFHADIFGASVVVLKDGLNASDEAKEETAQFAACYCRAWESGTNLVNVYAMRREQVSKSTGKGSLGTGSFALQGEREWFRNTVLELYIAMGELEYDGEKMQIPMAFPASTFMKSPKKPKVMLKPGNIKKSDVAKKIASVLKTDDIDAIMRLLPSGTFSMNV